MFVAMGLTVVQDSNNRFMSLLADCQLLHAWHAVLLTSFSVPLCRRILQVTPGRVEEGIRSLPLARRTVNSLCGMLQQLTGAKEVMSPVLEYAASAVLTLCAGFRAAAQDELVMRRAASRRISRMDANGSASLMSRNEDSLGGGPASAATLASMSRDEAARVVRGITQLLCAPLRPGQVDTGASGPARGQLACALSHVLQHLQTTRPNDGGFQAPLAGDDQSLLGIEGMREAGEALLGLSSAGRSSRRGAGDDTDDDGDFGFGKGGNGSRSNGGVAPGAVVDRAVIAAARGHGASTAEAGMRAAQALDGAVSALADSGDALCIRLATDCLEAPAYVPGEYDRAPDELSPPLLRSRDVYLHSLGVVMRFGAAAGGAARWCAELVRLGMPAQLVESMRTLDTLESGLRKRLARAGHES